MNRHPHDTYASDDPEEEGILEDEEAAFDAECDRKLHDWIENGRQGPIPAPPRRTHGT